MENNNINEYRISLIGYTGVGKREFFNKIAPQKESVSSIRFDIKNIKLKLDIEEQG